MDKSAVRGFVSAHECGYALFVMESEPGLLARLSFFDDDASSAGYGARVEVCPRCGDPLLALPSVAKYPGGVFGVGDQVGING